jgi:hypothetical protein
MEQFAKKDVKNTCFGSWSVTCNPEVWNKINSQVVEIHLAKKLYPEISQRLRRKFQVRVMGISPRPTTKTLINKTIVFSFL